MPQDPKKALSEESKRISMLALRALKDSLADGEITPSEFLTSFLQELKEEYIRQYILGIGGVDNMQPSDWGSIGGNLGSQYQYARDFGGLIEDGELSDAQIEARLDLYGESSDEIFELANYRRHELDGYTHERWILDDDKENCADCLALADLGWVELGTLPTPCDGSTACMNNCGCYKEYGEYDYERSITREGNSNSGNYGHDGRPGQVGGSAPNLSRETIERLFRVTYNPHAETGVGVSSTEYSPRIGGDYEGSERQLRERLGEAAGGLSEEEVYSAQGPTYFQPFDSSYSGTHVIASAARVFGLERSPYDIKMEQRWREQASAFSRKDIKNDMLANGWTYNARMLSDTEMDSLVRASYEMTQAAFRAEGITHITVYRGMTSDRESAIRNALESWTLDPKVAGGYGEIESMTVPVEQVFGIPCAGWGTDTQLELVIMNGIPVTNREIGRKDRDSDSDEIFNDIERWEKWMKSSAKTREGNENSGNYGHMGRPGEVGGSMARENTLFHIYRSLVNYGGDRQTLDGREYKSIETPSPAIHTPSEQEEITVRLNELTEAINGRTSEQDLETMDKWTHESHYCRAMCAIMRGQDTSKLDTVEQSREAIQALTYYLSDKYIGEDLILYRGVEGSFAQKLATLEPGDSFTDGAFFATSLSLDTAMSLGYGSVGSDSTVLRILAPAETHGALMTHSTYWAGEFEVLLQGGYTFEVISNEREEVGAPLKHPGYGIRTITIRPVLGE